MGWELVKDGEKTKCWLNLDEIENYYKGYDWKNSVGKKIGARYKWYHDEMEEKWFIIKEYLKENYHLILIDKNNNNFEIGTGNIFKGNFGKMFDKKTNKFKYNIGDEINGLKIIDREYKKDKKGQNHKYYQYQCLKCLNTDWIVECSLNRGSSCNVCTSQKLLTGVNDIATTHPHLCKYFKYKSDTYKYMNNSGKKVSMKCPHCKCEKKMAIYTLTNHGFSCSKCSDGKSIPEKFGANVFSQIGIDFKTQHKIGDYKYLYDFYIPDKKRLFETDGEQHYKDAWGNAEEQKQIDAKKDKIALDNGYELIRIDCYSSDFEYLKENFIKALSPFYNLSSVDWEKAYIKSQKSHMVLTCQLKKENPDLFTYEIVKLIKKETGVEYDKSTIIKWLNRGDKMGLCCYNGKEEVSRANKGKTGEKNSHSKPIVQIDTLTKEPVFTWQYKKQVADFYNISYSTLDNYLKGKRKTGHLYNGFLWYYLEDWQELTK